MHVSTPARQTLTERRAEELRLTIAMAARDVFIADGDTSATVDRICDIVGIAPRTFHRHFAVKEDVVLPLFGQYGSQSMHVLDASPVGADPVETLAQAFTTGLAEGHALDIDRRFMTLIVNDPQYRLRWLDWGEDLVGPITDFLASRYDLGTDRFIRTLPAQLIVQVCIQVYIHWVDAGDFTELEDAHRAGMQLVLNGLQRRSADDHVPAVAAAGT
ncbi:TetR/AcrR family transcriptional regulator [Mycobacterium sp. BMJ-28]